MSQARLLGLPNVPGFSGEAERQRGFVRCKPKLARHAPEHNIDAREYGGEARTWNLANPALEDASVERKDLRNVRDRRLREACLPRGKKHVPGCASPLDLGSKWHADNGCKGAAVQCVTLHHKDGSPKPRTGTDRIAEIRPPNLALSDHHSEFSRAFRAARWNKGSGSPWSSAHTRLNDSVTASGACRETNSAKALAYNSLREILSRFARCSASSKTSSGTETAVFIPKV